MNTLTPFLANWVWSRLYAPQYGRFLQSLDGVEEVQRRYLLRLVRRNAQTKYGRRYGFAGITSVEAFRQAVPLTRYEDYLTYVEEIAEGQTGVLTADRVILFQPSSGTSSASKLIPYTASLKADFQRAIAPWIVSLFHRKPDLMRGPAYWSISPPAQRPSHNGLIPVGFDDDSAYLGFAGKWLYNRVAAVPTKVASVAEADVFLGRTLVYLLAAGNLALISVWSPTLLTLLLRKFVENQDEILRQLADSGLPGAERRIGTIRRILKQEPSNGLFRSIWPNLDLISCWTHGPSQIYVREVSKYFPEVEIQGKGLVATEAFISLPLMPDRDPVLAVDSHFFEFQDVDSQKIRLAHELKEGEVYSVIVTTGGGLYRYQLGDLVRVTGFIGGAPALRFLTKEAVSDLFGEKLYADHVQRSVADAFAACSIQPSFFLLAPASGADRATYGLFIDIGNITGEECRSLIDGLEARLCENFHYAHCRRMGQLGPLQLFLIDASAGAPDEIFSREMQRRGIKLGDIKPAVLDRETGWEHRFSGRFISDPASGG
jgi:hypothetical protein